LGGGVGVEGGFDHGVGVAEDEAEVHDELLHEVGDGAIHQDQRLPAAGRAAAIDLEAIERAGDATAVQVDAEDFDDAGVDGDEHGRFHREHREHRGDDARKNGIAGAEAMANRSSNFEKD